VTIQKEAKRVRGTYLVALVALAVGLVLGSAGTGGLTGTVSAVTPQATPPAGEPASALDHAALLHRMDRGLQWLSEHQPRVMQGFQGVWTAYETGEALDARTKQLMALGIAVAVGSDGCIAFHTHGAMQAGLTRAELAEVLSVALAMGGGPAIAYASQALEAFDQFQAQVAAAGE
jgi:AhpD family alkylhydroperoxidase